MLESMGVDIDVDDWEDRAERRFRELIIGDDRFRAYVGVDEAGDVVASGAGWIDTRLPGPGHDGYVGHIASIATDPDHRSRGYGRAVFAAIMEWMLAAGVRRVDLFATAEGRQIYADLGFREPHWPALVWVHPDVTV